MKTTPYAFPYSLHAAATGLYAEHKISGRLIPEIVRLSLITRAACTDHGVTGVLATVQQHDGTHRHTTMHAF